jgi:AraC-like DNA-binding protein
MQQLKNPLPGSISKVLWPRPSLAGCIVGTFVRDTRGCSLTSAERMNHFAAGPYCGVSWFIEGEAHLVDWPDGADQPCARPPLPRLLFHGPQRTPTASWNPGPVYALITIFHADALAALAGLDISSVIDRVAPAGEVLPNDLMLACKAMWDEGDADERYRRFEDRLDPLWQQARPPGHVTAHMLEDWTRAIAVRAATSGPGQSLRQIERRIRSWTGQSLRGLQTNVRTEQTHALSIAQRGEKPDLAQLAAEAGFADQSHMTRHVKRETGFTPNQLRLLIETDESFWPYRLMGERY